MGTWCRPLPDGVACEDQRVAYNPTLGQGKAGAAKPVEVAAEVTVEPVVEVPVEVEVPVSNTMKADRTPKKTAQVVVDQVFDPEAAVEAAE